MFHSEWFYHSLKWKWPHSKNPNPKHLTMSVWSSPSPAAPEQPRAHDQGRGASSLTKPGSVHSNRSTSCLSAVPTSSITDGPRPRGDPVTKGAAHGGDHFPPSSGGEEPPGEVQKQRRVLTGLCWCLHLPGSHLPWMEDPACARGLSSWLRLCPFCLGLLSWSSTCTAGIPPKIYWCREAHTADTS